jgi:uncharacterized membrane-anchored protein YhcB (DUF1043 family)
MEQQKLIQLGIYLVIGIIIGLIIGFALWHGTPDTCAVPFNAVN